MLIFALYIIIDLLTVRILWVLTSKRDKRLRFSVIAINAALTLMTLFYAIKVRSSGIDYATPVGIMDDLHLNLLLFLTLFPRFILVMLHYLGALIRIKRKGYIKALTWSGIVIWIIIAYMGTYGYFVGRFNFKYENVEINIPDLNPDLVGLRMIHISDLHLGSFYGSTEKIVEMVEKINSLNPDLILNTGDFITLGDREFGRFDTVLVKMVSRYGRYAIIGNHDIGTYLNNPTPDDILETIANVSGKIEESGYTLLNRSNEIIDVGGAKLAIIGAETRGRHPNIIHPPLEGAVKGTIDADLRILLTHDPNHWDKVITETPGIELTLSGHTHGMQFGYIGKKWKWSPSKYFYPQWHGLFTTGDMNLYVNRGLGVLGIPVRFGMPPEITIITLTQ